MLYCIFTNVKGRFEIGKKLENRLISYTSYIFCVKLSLISEVTVLMTGLFKLQEWEVDLSEPSYNRLTFINVSLISTYKYFA